MAICSQKEPSNGLPTMMSSNQHYIENFRSKLETNHRLTETCWQAIKSLLIFKQLHQGEFFSQEGQYNREFAFLCQGTARIYYIIHNGTEYTKYFLQKNDFFTASIEPGMPSQVSIQALTDVLYLYIPYPKFEELIDKYGKLAVVVNRLLLAYFNKKQQREIRLLANTALQNYQLFLEEYPDLENKISHYHIASYLGITPTQLSRIRKKLIHQHL